MRGGSVTHRAHYVETKTNAVKHKLLMFFRKSPASGTGPDASATWARDLERPEGDGTTS